MRPTTPLLAGLLAALCCALPLAGGAAAAPAQKGQLVKGIVFPVVGPLTFWEDDFGAPRGNGPHEGNDIGALAGTPVVAVEDGTVELMRYGGGGWSIRLAADRGDAYYYLHLGPNSMAGKSKAYAAGLKSGDRVTQGQLIGYVGWSGNASRQAPHLHFEFHPNGGRRYISPFPILTAAPRLLFAMTPAVAQKAAAKPLSLSLRGKVSWVAEGSDGLLLRVRVRTAKLSTGAVCNTPARALVLTVPAGTIVERKAATGTPADLIPGEPVTVWTSALQPGIGAQLGLPGALSTAKIRVDG